VNHIDRVDGVVYLDPTKEQVKASPEVDTSGGLDDESRELLAAHYGNGYAPEQ
jgi:hypothetical protein